MKDRGTDKHRYKDTQAKQGYLCLDIFYFDIVDGYLDLNLFQFTAFDTSFTLFDMICKLQVMKISTLLLTYEIHIVTIDLQPSRPHKLHVFRTC